MIISFIIFHFSWEICSLEVWGEFEMLQDITKSSNDSKGVSEIPNIRYGNNSLNIVLSTDKLTKNKIADRFFSVVFKWISSIPQGKRALFSSCFV